MFRVRNTSGMGFATRNALDGAFRTRNIPGIAMRKRRELFAFGQRRGIVFRARNVLGGVVRTRNFPCVAFPVRNVPRVVFRVRNTGDNRFRAQTAGVMFRARNGGANGDVGGAARFACETLSCFARETIPLPRFACETSALGFACETHRRSLPRLDRERNRRGQA